MPATIKDIARKLNISVSTVSYALNDGPRNVPPEVKARVLLVAKELDYRPNRIARSLITRRSYTIGVIPAEIGTDMMLGPYMQYALNGIINEAEVQHQDVQIFTRYDQSDAERMADSLMDGRIDGAIFITPPQGSGVLKLVAARGIPHVLVSSADHPFAPVFRIDNEGGVAQAIDHLISLGHTRIGHIAGKAGIDDAEARLDAFRAHMAQRNLPVNESWIVRGSFTIDTGKQAANQLLDSPDRPTAIFCANDEMGVGALQVARDRGLDVPRDLSIVGFDDAPHGMVCFPTLTTVRQPIGEIGAAAVRALVALVEGNSTVSGKQFSAELVVRASTSRPKEDPS